MTSPLGAKKATIWGEMQNITSRITAESRSLTQEEINQYDALEKDLETVSASLAIEGRTAALETEFRATPGVVRVSDVTVADIETTPERRYADAFGKWTRYGNGELEPEQRAALRTGFISGTELRAQGVGVNSGGGFAVPPGFRDIVLTRQLQIGTVRAESEVISTDNGATYPWPTVDDTANVGAILAENTAVTEQDVALGQGTLGAYMYTSRMVRVSLQLIQDSGFPIDTWLPRTLADRIARIQNQHFTTGTGSAQPLGIQTSAAWAVSFAPGNTTSVTYAGMVTLIESIDPAYRVGAKFMVRSASAFRSLVDSTGRPLWEPSLQAGTPDSFLGYPIIINPDMPAAAASVKSILFGDLKAAYVIRDVTSVQMLRLEERFADFLQVAFLLFQRSDGTLQQVSAIRAATQSAT